MKKTNYNFWLAICYEITKALTERFKGLRHNKIVRIILIYCKHDWVLWRIESALADVDRQIEQLHKDKFPVSQWNKYKNIIKMRVMQQLKL